LSEKVKNHNSDIISAEDNDPGDETARNYRYQWAYGSILLIAALRGSGKAPYKAIWCEKHEDFLCERTDDKYDAIQVKTKQRETGYWELTNVQILKALKRFCGLEDKYGSEIVNFIFASNAEYSNASAVIKDKEKVAKSPIRMIEAIDGISTSDDLQSYYVDRLKQISNAYKENIATLIKVFQKLKLVLGPQRESFESEIVIDHLPSLQDCKNMERKQLMGLRDELIYIVEKSSSLVCDDPDRHIESIIRKKSIDSFFKAKRISIDHIRQIVGDKSRPPFRFSPIDDDLVTISAKEDSSILKQKLDRGNLYSHYESLRRRSISAEDRLIQLVYKRGDRGKESYNQVINKILSICSDEKAHAMTESSHDWGINMYSRVLKSLKDIAENSPNEVEGEPYDSLVGIIGLLTNECKVWWSEEFELEPEP